MPGLLLYTVEEISTTVICMLVSSCWYFSERLARCSALWSDVCCITLSSSLVKSSWSANSAILAFSSEMAFRCSDELWEARSSFAMASLCRNCRSVSVAFSVWFSSSTSFSWPVPEVTRVQCSFLTIVQSGMYPYQLHVSVVGLRLNYISTGN